MFSKTLAISLLLIVYGRCNAQTNGDDDGGDNQPNNEGGATAICVFGCVESFQKAGVQEGPDTATTTQQPLTEETCNGLNMESIEDMCNAYLKSDTCLKKCADSITKETLISGFDTICVKRIEDYKKHLPCYQKQCSTINKDCGEQRCGGSYSDASDQWLSLLRIKAGNTDSPAASRRKRGDNNAATVDDSGNLNLAQQSVQNPTDVEEKSPFIVPNDTCRFVSCKVNCSRPTIEKACGKEAYELLKQTSNILLAFLVVPLEQTWMSTFNATSPPEGLELCGPYAKLGALTASTASSYSGYFWSLLLSVLLAASLVRRAL